MAVVWLTVYLKEGSMGKDLKSVMIQFTLVQANIIEAHPLENQQTGQIY